MKIPVFVLTALFISQLLLVIPASGITPSSSDISPAVFSPGDGNGISDTTTITVEYTTGETLYVNIFNQSTSELVAEDRTMIECPTGIYKYTWDGKNDAAEYVPEGTYTVRVSDNPAENGDTIGTVDVDVTPPTSPSLSINGGAEYTTSQSVNLTISATGATQMKISNYANFSGATWESYATSKSWQLLAGDGAKTVYINFRDQAGANVSTSDAITLDTTLSDPSLLINSGASVTNNLSVVLTISAPDATYMRIDNNTDFNNMSWKAKTNTYNFKLPGGADGIRTVYLRVKDDAGNIKTTSDTITVDTQPPTDLSILIDNGASYTNTTEVSLTLSASGGPSKIYISNDKSSWTQYDYTTSLTWYLTSGDGLKTVYYKAADAAGNNATAVSATITLDTTDPSPVTLNSPADGATVTTQTPTLNWSDPNTDTKNFYIEILQSGAVIESGTTNSTTTSYTTGTLSSGTYSWRVTVYDNVNNSAVTSERSFTISITGLEIPSPLYPTEGAFVNDTTPRLIWSQVSGQSITYEYKYGLTPDNLDNTGEISNTYWDTKEYSHGQTIYWAVRARNLTDTTAYSTVRSFVIDIQPPTDLTISINNDNDYTTSTSVTLTLSATDNGAKYIMISNNADFTGASWESYATTKIWTLPIGDGEKKVYFKVKDNAMSHYGTTSYTSNPNIAAAIYDTIILDTTPPEVTPQSPIGTTTTTTNLAIRATFSDAGSGVNTSAVTMIIDGNPVTPTEITDVLVRYVMPEVELGEHTVTVSAKDKVGYIGYGNWSFTVVEEVVEEEPPIEQPSISISHEPTIVTAKDEVKITATLYNFNVDIVSVDLFWNDGTNHSKPMTQQTTTTYTATIGPFPEGTKVTYYVVVLDTEANETISSIRVFTVLDTSSPIITIVSPPHGSIITDRTPIIKATYSDPGGIDTASVKISLNKIDVTKNATVTEISVTYQPLIPLSYKTHEVTVKVKDKSGNPATKTWSFTVQAEEIEITETIEEIKAGETKTINLTKYKTPIDEIKITAAKDLKNVKINLTTTGEKPKEVTPPTQKVYLYLIIETNVETTDISIINITFKVEKTWLIDNNIDKNSVKLLRYQEGGWQELKTKITAEDDTYVYYEATTPGFSTFAIVGTPIRVEKPLLTMHLYIIIVAAIITIVVIILILFKTGRLYLE